MPRVIRPVMCDHPDRKHHAGGFCSVCYSRVRSARRQADPEIRARNNRSAAEYQARQYARNPEPQRAKMRALNAARRAQKAKTEP